MGGQDKWADKKRGAANPPVIVTMKKTVASGLQRLGRGEEHRLADGGPDLFLAVGLGNQERGLGAFAAGELASLVWAISKCQVPRG